MSKFHTFTMGDIFEITTPKKKFNANSLTFGGKYPYVVRSDNNNGIRGYIDEDPAYLNDGNTISFGQDTATMFYQKQPYITGDKIKIFTPKSTKFNKRNAQYLITVAKKAFSQFSWGSSSFNVNILREVKIDLPVDEDGEIDFPYMEKRIRELEAERIRELEAYLKVTGLSDYTLTPAEQAVLAEFRERERESRLAPFRIGDLFTNIQQGSRLTKNDQRTGDLAFVMSGITNTGLVSHISNPVPTFQENAITVDIFGNTFYRGYSFAASDDVGVLWNQDNRFNQYHLLYLTSVISKRLSGLFDYSHKLRASQLSPYEVFLPVDSKGGIDLNFMELYIRAQQKLAIKGVVQWREKYISTTRQIAMA